jgi:glycosyltransferase involved in cell wall biosynthesis
MKTCFTQNVNVNSVKDLKVYSTLPAPLEYRYQEYLAAKSKEIDFTLLIGDDSSSIEESRMKFHNVGRVINCRVSSIWKLKYQSQTILRFLFGRYDYFFIQAHLKYLDFWIISFLNLILGRKLLVHGQGLYRYEKPGFFRSLAYFMVIRSCHKYVCYNEYCMLDMQRKIPQKIRKKKIVYVNNIIRVENKNKLNRDNDDILFIGRLREKTGAEEFLKVFSDSDENRKFHVIGDGPQLLTLQEKYATDQRILFYGSLTDHEKINSVAAQCAFGVYPGDSGLSLVHYAALGLVPIFHKNLWEHMGPECGYFIEYLDELSFDKGNFDAILAKIRQIDHLGRTPELRNSMLELYSSIQLESFGEKFASLLTRCD